MCIRDSPYIQLLVMIAFIMVVYFAVTSLKKAEQNKVWVGLSKETAHQLGTPISSLMAWMELLEGMGVDPEVVHEMDKDVKRLSKTCIRDRQIAVQMTDASTCNMAVIPAANDTLVAVITTIATPAPDSKMTVYSSDFARDLTSSVFLSLIHISNKFFMKKSLLIVFMALLMPAIALAQNKALKFIATQGYASTLIKPQGDDRLEIPCLLYTSIVSQGCHEACCLRK